MNYLINNVNYSEGALFEKSKSMLIGLEVPTWEKRIWQFILEWIDKSTESFIQESSGSTGIAKKIEIKKKYAVESARKTILYFGLKEGQTIHLCMHPSYIGAKMIIVRAFVGGLNLSYSEASSNALNLVKHSVDLCAAVPLQVFGLLEQNKAGNPFIKNVLIGGGVIPSTLVSKIQNQQTKYYQSFGMTETISHIAIRDLGNDDTSYHCLEGISVSTDIQDNCLIVHAPELGVEHLKTNDNVNLINETSFEWLGRNDNVINSGGIKIHPEKIEKLIENLIKNPYYISSIADEKLGNRIVLYIASNDLLDQNALLLQLRQLLPSHHLPKEIIIESIFEYTPTGKIIRK